MKIEYDLTYLQEAYHDEIQKFQEEIQQIKEQIKNNQYPAETIIAGLLIQDDINLQPIYDKQQKYVKHKAREYLHNLLIDKDSAHDEDTKYNPYSLF